MVLAGCSDPKTPARCFKHDGTIVQDFPELKRSCFSLDVTRDAQQIALSDYTGVVEVLDAVHCNSGI